MVYMDHQLEHRHVKTWWKNWKKAWKCNSCEAKAGHLASFFALRKCYKFLLNGTKPVIKPGRPVPWIDTNRVFQGRAAGCDQRSYSLTSSVLLLPLGPRKVFSNIYYWLSELSFSPSSPGKWQLFEGWCKTRRRYYCLRTFFGANRPAAFPWTGFSGMNLKSDFRWEKFGSSTVGGVNTNNSYSGSMTDRQLTTSHGLATTFSHKLPKSHTLVQFLVFARRNVFSRDFILVEKYHFYMVVMIFTESPCTVYTVLLPGESCPFFRINKSTRCRYWFKRNERPQVSSQILQNT